MEIGLDLEGDGMYYVFHVMHEWHGCMAVSVAEVGERPSFISLSHCDGMHPNLLGERDSMTACVVKYVFSLVTQGMGFRRVHTQLAKKAAVMCGMDRWMDCGETRWDKMETDRCGTDGD